MALVAARAEPAGTETTATTFGPKLLAASFPQRQLETGPWILAAGADGIARRLRSAFPTVADRWTPQLGVKTGADDLFLVDHECPGTRPAVRGRDIQAWRCRPRRFVLWTHGRDGRPLAVLPQEVSEHLAAHGDRLRGRSDYRGGPPWQLFRTALGLARHRVVWPDLHRRLAAAVPDADVVPLDTVYGIVTRGPADAAALAALFNSRWLTALARLVADPARGGFRRFNARVVRALPVPAPESSAWRAPAAAGASGCTHDAAVADLYNLHASDPPALAPPRPPSPPPPPPP